MEWVTRVFQGSQASSYTARIYMYRDTDIDIDMGIDIDISHQHMHGHEAHHSWPGHDALTTRTSMKTDKAQECESQYQLNRVCRRHLHRKSRAEDPMGNRKAGSPTLTGSPELYP